MIDSLVPPSDPSAKRPLVESELPRCKKRKKVHKWAPKCAPELKQSKCKSGKKLRPKPEAPFNSTQFIMEEHDCLNESDLSRRRSESSPSVDSDDPTPPATDEGSLHKEDSSEQENFISEQFWFSYHDLNAQRMNDLSKAQLVQEYFAVEEKLNILESHLSLAKTQDRTNQRIRAPSPECEDVPPPGEVPVDAETAAKIEVFRNEIEKLFAENEILRNENETLDVDSSSSFCRRCALRGSSSNCTTDDEDGSSSSCTDSYESEDSSEETATKTRKLLLSSLSPPTTSEVEAFKGIIGSLSEKKKMFKSDLVSDSGIASASSGDDLRLEDREEDCIRDKDSNTPFYSSSVI